MKKQNIFKAIFITIISVSVLTWLIPAGTISGTEVVSNGLSRIGLFDFIQYPIVSFEYFINIVLFIFGVGAFYGLLSKSGKYSLAISKVAKNLKGKEKIFLVGTTLFFAALTAVFGFNLSAFALIPLFVAIILAIGYDKMSAFLATFGATIIGVMGSLYNYNVNYYINKSLSLADYNSDILIKLAILIIPLVVFINFMLSHAEKAKKVTKGKQEDSNKDVFELVEKSKKGSTGIIVVLSALIVILILAVSPWFDIWKVEFFKDITTSILEFEVGGHAIFAYLLGNIEAFGSWSYEQILVLLAVAGIIIASMSNMKLETIGSGLVDGIKKMVKPACAVSIAYTVLVLCIYFPFFSTIEGFLIGLVDKFNVLAIFTTSLTTIFGTVLHIEPMYATQQVLPLMAATYADNTGLIALIFQSMYGLTAFVAPTSALLILGLQYLEIPYTSYLKSIWKTVLTMFVLVLIILIATFFIL